MTACRRLLMATSEARGVSNDPAVVLALATAELPQREPAAIVVGQ